MTPVVKANLQSEANPNPVPRLTFVHVDAALGGLGGHYADYALAVLSAAGEAGYRRVLVTPKDAPWPGNPGVTHLPLLSRRYRDAVADVASAADLPAFRVKGKTRQAAEAMVGKSRLAALPRPFRALALGVAAPVGAAMVAAGPRAAFRDAVTTLVDDVLSAFETLGLRADDVVFFPSATAIELTAVELLSRRLEEAPHFALVLRRDPDHEPGEPPAVLRTRRRRLQGAAARLPVSATVLADTEELAERYGELLRRPVRFAPIPVGRAAPPVPPQAGWTLGHLGDARSEKGFTLLPDIAAKLPSDVRLQAQANTNDVDDPAVAEAIARLKNSPQVTLARGPFDRPAYRDRLAAADALLLPYDALAYRRRSSGVFAEALASGRPVIVTEGTWMARQLQTWEQAWLLSELDRGGATGRQAVVLTLTVKPGSLLTVSHASGWSAVRHALPRLAVVPPEELSPDGFAVVNEHGRKVKAGIAVARLPEDGPLSKVGVIAPHQPAAFANAAQELDRFREHYWRSAASIADTWRERHSETALLDALERRGG